MANHLKLTPDKVDQLMAALRAGADVRMGARAVGVSASAIEKRRQSDPGFRAQLDEARTFADELIEKRLFDKAREGDTTAMIFWLKNRRRQFWRDRWDLEVSGNDLAPIAVTFRTITGATAAGKPVGG